MLQHTFSRKLLFLSASQLVSLLASVILLSSTTPFSVADIDVFASADGRGTVEPGIVDNRAIAMGGLQPRLQVIDQLRKSGGSIMLLEAGNFLFGPDLDHENSDRIGMAYQQLQYDAINLGVSDFSQGVSFIQNLANTYNLPVVSANIYRSNQGGRAFEPYRIVDMDRQKIAVIGLTEPPITRSFLPYPDAQLDGVEIKPLESALTEILSEVYNKADHVILLYAGSPKGLTKIRSILQEANHVDIMVAAGTTVGQAQTSEATPLVLNPRPYGVDLSHARLSASDWKTLPSLEIGPEWKSTSRIKRRVDETDSPEFPTIPSVENLEIPQLPKSIPEPPELNRFYRIQGRLHNRGADIELLSAGLFNHFGDLSASEGHTLLVLRSSWENNIPLILKQNQGLATEYRFPALGDHLYAVVNGHTLARLYAGEALVPDALPTKPLSLPFIGMKEEGNVVFDVPSDSIQSIELRLYDYAHGHQTYLLQGTPPPAPEPVYPATNNEVVEAGIYSFTKPDQVGEWHAKPGMTFVAVDFRAQSRFTFEADATAYDPHAKPGSRIQIGTVADWKDGDQYDHLVVDGQYAYRPIATHTGLVNEPRFLLT